MREKAESRYSATVRRSVSGGGSWLQEPLFVQLVPPLIMTQAGKNGETRWGRRVSPERTLNVPPGGRNVLEDRTELALNLWSRAHGRSSGIGRSARGSGSGTSLSVWYVARETLNQPTGAEWGQVRLRNKKKINRQLPRGTVASHRFCFPENQPLPGSSQMYQLCMRVLVR